MSENTINLSGETTAYKAGRALGWLAFVGMAGHGLAMTITGAALPEIMNHFTIRETLAGLFLAVGSLGFMFGCLLSGFITDETGIKPVLLGSWLAVGLSLLAFTVAPSFAMLMLCNGLLGIASGCLETCLNVMPTQIGGGAGLMNLVHMGFGFGAMAAPLFVGYVLNAGWGWSFCYIIIAILPFLLFFWGLSMKMPEAAKKSNYERDSLNMRLLWRQPLLLMSGLALLFYVAAEMGISSWIVLFLRKEHAVAPLQANLALSLFWGAVLLGRLTQGWLTKRFSLPGLVVINAALCGFAILAVGLLPSTLPVYMAVFGAGLTASGIYPNVMAYANGSYPKQIGAITGILSMVAAAGSFCFQPIVGRIGESFGLKIGLISLSMCMLLVVVSYLPAWARKAPIKS